MEWIATLDFEKIANAIIILLTGCLAAFGLRRGKAHPDVAPDKSPHVEIAGALVDSSSVKLLAGELAGQAVAITAQTAVLKDQNELIEAQTKEAEEVRHSLNRVREALDRVSIEMARRR